MNIITYSLGETGTSASESYYHIIRGFAKTVLVTLSQNFHRQVSDFRQFLREQELEEPRSMGEYYIELLTLAVLWDSYALAAHKTHRELTGETLGSLLNYLAQSKEFPQEIVRLTNWARYFRKYNLHMSNEISSLAKWFEKESRAVLGCYTQHVEAFLQENQEQTERQDWFFRARKRVEYHLNMVGAEIMNDLFWDAFTGVTQVEVLVPICMTANFGECKSQVTPLGRRCIGCQENCKVNRLQRQGREEGFGVLVVSHSSTAFSRQSEQAMVKQGIGVVGVACVLTLLSGGWRARALNIPAQCVPLDYCGCKTHWHSRGLGTKFSLEQLIKILAKWKRLAC